MNRIEQIQYLTGILLAELPQYRVPAAAFPPEEAAQRRLLRSLMNVRPPLPLRQDFLTVQDELLSAECAEKGVIEADTLPATAADSRLVLWRGDITRLRAGAIVNAANSGLLGCFCPCHGCIDNAIHSAAGLQLRDACHQLMQKQGHPEPVGQAKRTDAYNLPCRYVLHTVGPQVPGQLRQKQRAELAGCYRACLTLAAQSGLETIAFCCISTGEFHFPNQQAAETAVETVREFLQQTKSEIKVIFNVYKETDDAIYRKLLGPA